jgi:peptidoglycan/LPS O-acetylase OafA/YrhL
MIVGAEASKNSARDTRLDILRAVAILYIIAFWHLDDFTAAFTFESGATFVVTDCVLGLFTFISGLLLSRRYTLSSLADVGRFYQRRFVRIYPMFALVLTAFLAARVISQAQYFRGLFLMNMILRDPPKTLWFVEMICLFYLLAPAFLAGHRVGRTIVLMALVFAGLVAACRLSPFVDPRLPLYFIPFAVGIVAAHSPLARVLTRGGLFGVGAGVGLATLIWVLNQNQPWWADLALRELAILVSLPAFFLVGSLASPVLKGRLLAFLSYCSLAMYLVHRITFGVADMLYHPQAVVPAVAYLYGVALPATVLAAWAFQAGYDYCVRKLLPRE